MTPVVGIRWGGTLDQVRASKNCIVTTIVISSLAACSGQGASGGAAECGLSGSAAQELIAFEEQRIAAFMRRDWQSAAQMHSEDFEFTNPLGRVSNKAEYLDPMESGDFQYLVFEPVGPMKVRVCGNAGALRYRSKISVEGGFGVLPPRAHLHTDYYEKRGGRWQIVYSQATFDEDTQF